MCSTIESLSMVAIINKLKWQTPRGGNLCGANILAMIQFRLWVSPMEGNECLIKI